MPRTRRRLLGGAGWEGQGGTDAAHTDLLGDVCQTWCLRRKATVVSVGDAVLGRVLGPAVEAGCAGCADVDAPLVRVGRVSGAREQQHLSPVGVHVGVASVSTNQVVLSSQFRMQVHGGRHLPHGHAKRKLSGSVSQNKRRPARHGRGARWLPLTFSFASHSGLGLSLTDTGTVSASCTEQQQTAHGARTLMLRIASAAAVATCARRSGPGANEGPEGADLGCLRDAAAPASSRAWRSVPCVTESMLHRRSAGTSNNVRPEPTSITSCGTTAPADSDTDSDRTPSERTTASSCDEGVPLLCRT